MKNKEEQKFFSIGCKVILTKNFKEDILKSSDANINYKDSAYFTSTYFNFEAVNIKVLDTVFTLLHHSENKAVLRSSKLNLPIIIPSDCIELKYKKDIRKFIMNYNKYVKDYRGLDILKEESVLTRDNKICHISEIREIRGEYYHISSLVYDEFINDYVLPQLCRRYIKNLSYLYEGNNFLGCEITEYAYTSDKTRHFPTMLIPVKENNNDYYIIATEVHLSVVKDNKDIVECKRTGLFYHKDTKNNSIVKAQINEKYEYIQTKRLVKINDKKDQINFGEESLSYLITDGKKYSFGVELETASGYLPLYLYHDLNMSCTRDGSVTGGEYVTGVLKGDSGFKQLQKITNELVTRCSVDAKCGIHVHIGGFDNSKSFLVLLQKLGVMLENEIFSILPPSRRNNKYCQKMKNLNIVFPQNQSLEEYDILFNNYYHELYKLFYKDSNILNKDINKKFNHPRGRTCGYDQNTPRYWWLNLIPAAFNTRGNFSYTVEFRNHSGSLNYRKIKNWVLICMGIVSYVENYKKDIMFRNDITLEEIITKVYPTKSRILIPYIQERKSQFENEDYNEVNNEYKEKLSSEELSVKQLINI